MGIRVHKVLGYGLTDVDYDRENWKMKDPRINTKAPFLYCGEDEDDEDTFDSEPSAEDYLAWLEDNASDRFSLDKYLKSDKVDLNKGRKYSLYDCVHFQPEFGESSVLVIRPLSCPDWSRYDDAIDYVESAYLHPDGEEPCINNVRKIDAALYPWSGCYMDKRTGKRVDSEIMWWIRCKNAAKEGRAIPGQDMDKLAVVAGFADHEDALANCRPMIPEPIVDLCKFLKIFKDDKYILDLEPVLYTYWS